MSSSPDQLRELFRMQKALNERIGVLTDQMDEAEKTRWVLNYTRAMTQELAELTALTPTHGGWSPGDGGAGDAYWREGREQEAALDAAVAAAEAELPRQLRADMAAWRVATELLLLEQDRGGTLRPRVRLTGAEAAEARWPTIASAVEAAITGPDRQMGGVWLWVQTWAAQEWGAGPIQAAEAAVRLMRR
jgi:hypothetical protein